MKIYPVSDRLLVRREESDSVSPGGIHIPGAAAERKRSGIVIAVGPGKWEGNKLIPLQVEVENRVLFSEHAGTEIEFEGEKYLMIRESEVLAILY